MDAQNMPSILAAHVDALTQLSLATIALQATGRGTMSPSLQKDINDLMTVSHRVEARLSSLADAMATA